jgi:predicted glutamine amidotransferase
LFGQRGRHNLHGWGLGWFRKNQPVIEKSADRVCQGGKLHAGFQRLARVISSPLLMAHLRQRSSGGVDESHAHPFTLPFLGQDWLFAHNGKAPAIETYQTRHLPAKVASSDSARIFEYLRDYLVEVIPEHPDTGFFELLCRGVRQLLEAYPGEYNWLLASPQFLFVFTNHRQFRMLKGSTKMEEALLLTTIDTGLSAENWQNIVAAQGSLGKLMVFSAGDCLLSEDLYP